MVLAVQRLESLIGHMSVNLGSGEIGVAQQHLHHTQIGAVIEQMGGKGVAQGVGRQLPADTGTLGIELDLCQKV